MKNEIKSAAEFLCTLLRAQKAVTHETIESFRARFSSLLCKHYQNHWFPEQPCKGSGYRCIRINHKMDPIVKQAALDIGLHEPSLRTLLPSELTMWVDPRDVSYRFGENGSIGMLYESDLPHVVAQKHKEKQSQREQAELKQNQQLVQQQQQQQLLLQQQQFHQGPTSQSDLEFNTIGYSCKDQLMNVLPNVSRDSLKQLAAFV